MPGFPQFRFSLRQLLLVVLLASAGVWLVAWPLWDRDERLLLGLWLFAVSAAIGYSQQRNRRGVRLATVVGGITPLAAYAMYAAWVWLHLLPERWMDQYIVQNAAATSIVGAAAAMIFATVFTPHWKPDLSIHQRSARIERRQLAFAAGVLAAVLLVGAWTVHHRSHVWPTRTLDVSLAFVSGVDVTRDGTRLVAYQKSAGRTELHPSRLEIVDLESLVKKPIVLKLSRGVNSVAFSPDGSLLAVAAGTSPIEVTIFDAKTGQLRQSLSIQSEPGNVEDAPVVTFAPDGSELWLRTFLRNRLNTNSYLRVWNTADWTLISSRSYAGACFVVPSLNGLRLICVQPGSVGNPTYTIAVVDRDTGVCGNRLGPFQDFVPLQFALDGDKLAVGSVLADFKTGEVERLPKSVSVCGFLASGRRILANEHEFGHFNPTAPSRGPTIYALPLVRHLWRHGLHSRFVVFDLPSRRRMAASQWVPGGYQGKVVMPEDGSSAIVGKSIWTIPRP